MLILQCISFLHIHCTVQFTMMLHYHTNVLYIVSLQRQQLFLFCELSVIDQTQGHGVMIQYVFTSLHHAHRTFQMEPADRRGLKTIIPLYIFIC